MCLGRKVDFLVADRGKLFYRFLNASRFHDKVKVITRASEILKLYIYF